MMSHVTGDFFEYNVTGETDTVAASVRFDLETNEITFAWAFGRSGPQFYAPPIADLTVHQSVGFSVTAIAFTIDGSLIVAGMNRGTGRTHVERWAFAAPKISRRGGETSIVAGRVREREVIFEEPVDADLNLISWIWCHETLGADNFMFTTFPDSCVYTMSMSSASATKHLDSYAPVGNQGAVPELDYLWSRGVFVGNHLSYGWCFALVCDNPDPSGVLTGGLECLVLYDADRNGIVDGTISVPYSQFSSLDLDSGSDSWLE